ncbi:hypothetical protein M8C21_003020 [Ambrosia artemisiifolia]|uniref:Uncharacterized protein n=1 Tax=Ambrosia artemisiifolia TaxID=4212 RepID=A0AAD5BV45_AMBAR|nr:hypothetical protein M8C21_003020 [Ambrosia artemisiifolia]
MQDMEDAIEAMNGMDLDGRNITVDKAHLEGSEGTDYDGNTERLKFTSSPARKDECTQWIDASQRSLPIVQASNPY